MKKTPARRRRTRAEDPLAGWQLPLLVDRRHKSRPASETPRQKAHGLARRAQAARKGG